jgi:hypothetical protein
MIFSGVKIIPSSSALLVPPQAGHRARNACAVSLSEIIAG